MNIDMNAEQNVPIVIDLLIENIGSLEMSFGISRNEVDEGFHSVIPSNAEQTHWDTTERYPGTHSLDVNHRYAKCYVCGFCVELGTESRCDCELEPDFDDLRKGIHDEEDNGQFNEVFDSDPFEDYYAGMSIPHDKEEEEVVELILSKTPDQVRDERTYRRFPISMRKLIESLGLKDDPGSWLSVGSFFSCTDRVNCPICRLVMSASATAITSDGYVLRKSLRDGDGNLDIPVFNWNIVTYVACSAGFNYKAKVFKPFGRILRLLYKGIRPVHNLGRCDLIYLSDLVTDLRHLTDGLTDQTSRLPAPTPTATTRVRLVTNSENRYFNMPTIAISQYVGISVVLPERRAHQKDLVKKFWHWKAQLDGTRSEIVTRTQSLWKQVCGNCLVAVGRKGSFTRALLDSGSPDPLLRMIPDYYEDLLEQVVEAEKLKRFTVFAMEPVLKARHPKY